MNSSENHIYETYQNYKTGDYDSNWKVYKTKIWRAFNDAKKSGDIEAQKRYGAILKEIQNTNKVAIENINEPKTESVEKTSMLTRRNVLLALASSAVPALAIACLSNDSKKIPETKRNIASKTLTPSIESAKVVPRKQEEVKKTIQQKEALAFHDRIPFWFATEDKFAQAGRYPEIGLQNAYAYSKYLQKRSKFLFTIDPHTNTSYASIIDTWAKSFNIPQGLIVKIMFKESAFNFNNLCHVVDATWNDIWNNDAYEQLGNKYGIDSKKLDKSKQEDHIKAMLLHLAYNKHSFDNVGGKTKLAGERKDISWVEADAMYHYGKYYVNSADKKKLPILKRQEKNTGITKLIDKKFLQKGKNGNTYYTRKDYAIAFLKYRGTLPWRGHA